MLINPYRFSQLWTPANITTALWLDAADASTVTESSGLISQVNDKSGNSRNFTASGGARPTLTSNGLNGLPVMTFGGSQCLTSADTAATWNFLHNSTGGTIWIIAKPGNVANPQAEYGILGNNAGSSSLTGFVFYYSDVDYGGGKNNDVVTDFTTRGVSTSFVVTNVSDNNSLTANAPCVLSLVKDPGSSTAASRSSIKVNGGSSIQNNGAANPASTANAAHSLQIGAFGNNAGLLQGYISEVIIQQSQAPLTTLQRVEGYLAHKWGLAANLPSDHPYKSAAPTI